MDIGQVVMANKGKEKGQIFVVVKTQEKFAFIADGKRVSVLKPKKKNEKHIQKVSKNIFPENQLKTCDIKINAAVRKFLKDQKEALCQKKMS